MKDELSRHTQLFIFMNQNAFWKSKQG